MGDELAQILFGNKNLDFGCDPNYVDMNVANISPSGIGTTFSNQKSFVLGARLVGFKVRIG